MEVVISGLNNYAGLRCASLMGDDDFRISVIIRSESLLRKKVFEPLKAELLEMDLVGYHPNKHVLGKTIEAAYYFTQVPTLGETFARELELLCLRNFIRLIQAVGCNRLIYVTQLVDKVFIAPILQLLREYGMDYTIVLKQAVIGRESLLDRIIKKVSQKHVMLFSKAQFHSFFQPLGAQDFVDWLKQILRVDKFIGKVLEIGGVETFTLPEFYNLYRKMGVVKGDVRFFQVPAAIARMFHTYRLGLDKVDNGALDRVMVGNDRMDNVWTTDMPFAFKSIEQALFSDYNI